MTPAVLAEIHALCFTTPRPWNAAEFAGLLAEKGTILIAESPGFLLARTILDEAEILTLAVLPNYRRHGIATCLLDRFTACATDRGVTTVFLEVAADNHAALALYSRAGFTQTATRKSYYSRSDGNRVDAVILSLSLA
jgi:ribosomal-protein-alanine N-acetyltransferase